MMASAPSPGWWLDDQSKEYEVEFRTDDAEVEVTVTCGAGTPAFSVEGPRDDGAPGSPASSPSTDDSDGRVGGGHGSDDGPGDDSSGRRGGHGSDD